jgi:FkbM family methyltransferase
MMSWLKAPLRLALNSGFFRNRVAFELRQRHYQDLGISVPLGHGLQCPIVSTDYWYSFSEIFLLNEYSSLFHDIPLPDRWLDLGCHAGFFSLWVVWQRAQLGLPKNCQALLVDADSRVQNSVKNLIAANQLETQFRFRPGAISEQPGELLFAEQSCMSSSAADFANPTLNSRSVRVLEAGDLLRELPGPYDVVKLDVEGSEYDFLKAYQPVLDAANYLLLEWHSWHKGGGGGPQIKALAEDAGFDCMVDQSKAEVITDEGKRLNCGVFLLRRRAKIRAQVSAA